MLQETTNARESKGASGNMSRQTDPAEIELADTVFASFLNQREDPDWLRVHRRRAWETYRSLPMPSSQDEKWRRTDFSRLHLTTLTPGLIGNPAIDGDGESGATIPPSSSALLNSETKFAGQLVQYPGRVAQTELQNQWANQGVIFCDLRSAINKYPELVAQYLLNEPLKSPDDKFAHLHTAFSSDGLFLFVPPAVHITLPVYAFYWLSQSGIGVYPHTLLIAEQASKVTLIDEYSSTNNGQPAFANGITQLYLKRNAQVTFFYVQRWSDNICNLFRQQAVLAEGARLTSLNLSLGASLSRVEIESRLGGPGATSLMFGLAVGDKQRHIEQHTLQEHIAPHTTSDLLFKTVLKDQAYSVFSGLIRVDKAAQRTDAYQSNRNLLLSEKAKADTLPKLEILANDVRCTHGATAGPIDEEQCFYLMSRGLPRQDTERLIVNGFFEEVFKRIPVGKIKEQLLQYIDQKLGL